MSEFASVFDVSSIDGNNGFRIAGTAGTTRTATIGDINGDGFDDYGVSVYGSSTVHVVFGGAANLAALDAANGASDGTLDIGDLDGNNGYTIDMSAVAGTFGFSLNGIGDVNNDGVDDAVFGSRAGYAVITFGSDDPFPAVFAPADISEIDGTNAYILAFSGGSSSFGYSVSSAGDINGDGIGDIAVAAHVELSGGVQRGAVYVVFGGGANLAALDAADTTADGQIDLHNLDGNNGFRLRGTLDYAVLGSSVAPAGDVNGDGFDDLVVGATHMYNSNTGAGHAYIVYGTDNGFAASFNTSHLTGNVGHVIDGAALYDQMGTSVASAGDVNADGIDDIVVGGRRGDGFFGAAYVVFGMPGDGGITNVTQIDGNNGFKLAGEAFNSNTGMSVSSAGDVNGDGFDDVLVGATGLSYGAAYVVFGKAGGFSASLALGSLDGNNGFKIDNDGDAAAFGRSTAAAGDVNGDGFADILVSAAYDFGSGTETYIVYGHKPDEAVTRVGTAIANTIHGSDSDDSLNGQAGSDTLIGHDGNDAIKGCGEDDTVLGGAGADDIKGGGGADALNGGADGDNMSGGQGANTFVYEAASDSAGTSFDRIADFDASKDSFDLWFTVNAIDAPVADVSGVDDLETEVGAAQLGANNAVVVTLHNGRVFLVVDANGTAGYQDGADLLMRVDGGADLNFTVGDFI